jgi:hypothetical protein
MMQRARRSHRYPAFLAACGSALTLAGCFSGASRPEKEGQTYGGPPISIESSEAVATAPIAGLGMTGAQHIVVLAAPTAGWSFTLDSVQDAYQRREVYLTIMRPNPAYPGARAAVQQRMASEVELRAPIDVYARVLDYTPRPEPSPYRYAGSSDR